MMNSREIIIPAASPDYAEIIPQSEKKKERRKNLNGLPQQADFQSC